MREDDELSTKTTPHFKKPAAVFNKLSIQDSGQVTLWFVKPRKSKKELVWTNTEMNDLVLVLVRRKKQYTVRLETLALKKSSNNQVFEEISKDFEKLLFV